VKFFYVIIKMKGQARVKRPWRNAARIGALEHMTQSQQGIRSLETGIRVFQEVHRLSRPATLTEIAKLSRMEPAKAHRYCVSLIRTGLLQQDGRGLYAVGPFGFSLSRHETDLDNARALTIAALPHLVAQIGETVFVASWGQTGPVIVKVEDAPKPIAIRPTTKGDLPLLNSSTGRVFVAYMDEARRDGLIETAFNLAQIPARDRGRQRRDFLTHLEDVKKYGIARTTGERYPGLVSFSAPIFDHNGRVVLALTSFGLSGSFPSAWNAALPRALRDYVMKLTKRIGGNQPDARKTVSKV
jgi:DNA-binding IclR family transcriptional regulator